MAINGDEHKKRLARRTLALTARPARLSRRAHLYRVQFFKILSLSVSDLYRYVHGSETRPGPGPGHWYFELCVQYNDALCIL